MVHFNGLLPQYLHLYYHNAGQVISLASAVNGFSEDQREHSHTAAQMAAQEFADKFANRPRLRKSRRFFVKGPGGW